MSNQIVISSGAKVRELEGVLTGTAGIVNALGINVPSGIPQLDGSGKILVSQLPNSVMEYKGTWNAATNTPTLADGTGNQGDVYLCNVAGTVDFGAGPIAFFVGDQVIYSGTIWQRASGATGTVTSVAVTESGDALTITGSPITTSGTINIGFTGNSGQYVNGAGGLTTFPTDNITGSGASGQVTYFNGTNTITGENAFNYDATNNRLGVNTTVPNATIGANAGTDSGYSLLVKNDNANYNGIGFATDSTYGNLIATEKLGTATAKNLTLLNQSGFISLTEAGNLGVGILTPNTGLDIYNGTSAYLWLHTANSGITGTDGVRLALFNTNGANLRNYEGAFSITAEGDFSVITLGAENFRVNSSDGSIYQSKVANAMLKSVSGVITAAVAGTDYVAPSSLSSYVPYTGATTNVNLGTHSLTAADLVINHASGSGVAASITKGGAGEALTVVKTSGSGNAASITGGVTLLDELHLNTDLADAYIASAATWNAKMSGSGVSGRVAYYDGTNSITSEAGFIYDASTNRLGVNTTVPNATIGADSALDSGYGLLIKTGSSNYNGIGIAIDSTYGNLISTEKLGSASARNLTLLNQSGFISLTEAGNLGLNVLTPAVSGNGIDIYGSTSVGLRFHTAASGTTVTDGAGINFSAANNLGITNYEAGTIDIVTNGNSGVFVATNGFVGINGATPSVALTVNGAISQTSVTSSLIKTDSSGLLVAAVAGTDYVAPSALSSYVPTSRNLTINGTSYDLSADRSWSVGTITGSGTNGYISFFNGSTTALGSSLLYNDTTNSRIGLGTTSPLEQFHIYNASAAASFLLQTNSATAYSEISVRNASSVSTSYFRQYSSSASGTDFGASRANLATFFSNYASNFAIGTQNGGDLILGTANTERLRVLASNGNVGIGLSNPSNILHLYATAPILAIESSTTGNVFLRMLQMGTVVSSLFYNNATSTLTLSNNNSGIQFNTSGVTGAMSITSAGNVGIGTSTINGSTNYKMLRINGTNGGEFTIAANEVDRGYIYASSGDFSVLSLGAVPLVLGTNGSERMRITIDGYVGIGTSSPTNPLHIVSNSVSQLNVAALSGNTNAQINLEPTGTGVALIGPASAFPLTFRTDATERMRITSDGQISQTSPIADWSYVMTNNNASSPNGMIIQYTGANKNNSSNPFLYCTDNFGASLRFVVYSNGNVENQNNSYGAISDIKLKENITDASPKLNDLLKVKIRNYNLIGNEKKQLGVIAQELEEIFPSMIDESEDFELVEITDKEGNINTKKQSLGTTTKSVKYSVFVPMLIKAIQEQQAQIEELKALINK